MKARCTIALLPLLAIFSNPINAGPSRRAPVGSHEGRCLYVVDGKQRIAGRCFYQVYKGGEFHIDGPRQVFGGARGLAGGTSKDWWANVFKDDDGTWTGYGNAVIDSVRGEGPNFGPMRREDACFVGERVKVCLWRE